MASHRWSIAATLCGVLLIFGSAKAGPSIQGVIVDKEGKPVPGVVVRAERKDATAAPVVTKTDARGLYVFNSLPAGKYKVTAVADGGAYAAPRMATVSSTGDDGQPIRRFISPLPYQVRPDYRTGTPANVRGRYVWKSDETGSHIGGRWITPDEAQRPSTNPLEIIGGPDVSHSPCLRLNSAAK